MMAPQVMDMLRAATRTRYGQVSRPMLQQLIDTRAAIVVQMYEAAGSLAAVV